MKLPALHEIRDIQRINPGILMIYSPEKTGKTSILAQLKNNLIIELEPRGGEFVRGLFVDVDKPSVFNDVIRELKILPPTYDYITIDTVTRLDEFSEILGTIRYMDSSMGKKFNRTDEGEKIMPGNPMFETVHSLANGAGYYWSRTVMLEWFRDFETLVAMKKVKGVILVAHIKDKLVEAKDGTIVESTDIDLTGKVKNIYCTKVDSVGFFDRRGEEGKIFFNKQSQHKASAGGRAVHLEGEVLISKMQDGVLTTYWDNVFIPETPKTT